MGREEQGVHCRKAKTGRGSPSADPEWVEKQRARKRELAKRRYHEKKAQGGPSEEEKARKAAYNKAWKAQHRGRVQELNRQSAERNADKLRAKRARPEEKQKARLRLQRFLRKHPGYYSHYDRNRRKRPDGWSRRMYLKHRAKIRASAKVRYAVSAEFREAAIRRSRTWYRRYRARALERQRQYRLSQAKEVQDRARAYRLSLRGRIRRRENRRAYYGRLREPILARNRVYRTKIEMSFQGAMPCITS